MKVEFWLACKFIFRGKSKHISFISCVSFLGLALGVCALIVVLGVMNGFDKNLTEKLLGFNFHLIAYLQEPDSQIAREVRKLNLVENAVLCSQIQTAARKDKVIAPVVLEAVDFNPQEEKVWSKYLEKGDFEGLLIGKVLAKNLHLNLGEEIEIFNPKTLKPQKVKIGGLFSFGIYDLDSSFIVSPYSLVKDFLEKAEALPLLGIRIKDIHQAEKVKAKLLSQGIPGISLVRTWAELNQTLFSALRLEKITMFVILSLIILVACFNIFATQTVRVVEKTKDIGILKSIGLRKASINFLFSIQGLILGFIGVGLGAGLGLFLCFILEKFHFIKLPSKIYYIDYLPVLIDYKDVVLVCLVGLGFSLLFSLSPAIKASNVEEAKALRYE